jgi:RNA polymerase sigma factor (sigma-70 family)
VVDVNGPDPAPRPRALRSVRDEVYADWDALYLDNVRWVYRLMFSRVGNRSDAEDLTAEVFLAVLRPLDPTVSTHEVRGYLSKTAASVLAAFWKRRLGREINTIELNEWEHTAPPPLEPARPEQVELAAALLAGLPDRARRVLELRFLEGASLRETAHELGVTTNYVKVLQFRALRLAARLHDDGATGAGSPP